MIRGFFWRVLLLFAAFLALAGFLVAAAAGDPFQPDTRALMIGAILAVIGAPLLAAATTLLAQRRLGRSVEGVSERIRAALEGGPTQLAGAGRTDEATATLFGAIDRLSREVEAARERHGAQAALLRRTIDGLRDGVVFLDRGQAIVIANRAAELMLGLGTLVGRRLVEVIRAPELATLVEAGEGQLELPARGLRPTMLIDCRRLDEGGSLLTLRDVGELRRLERVRRDFVANVSHELRTPVAAVKMNAETLLGGALEEAGARRGFLEAIERNAHRLESLLADLLDLSEVESGQRELRREAVAPAEVAREVIGALADEAQGQGVTIELAIDEAAVVLADRLALQQILHNLVENALRYGAKGGRVRVEASAVDGGLELRIVDDGPGIEPRHHDRIFERFYRVDPGRSRAAGGTGLGLSIVRNLCEAMDGSVGVRPNAPRGSVFWLWLPLA
ncbi:MAG: ATP-binding protein [Deltaproteobacteria bacterium]|nr:ATP-binding protein [Deltaproteobacteria bacterium]